MALSRGMRPMQSDAARLALLDGASTISRTLRSFVQDTPVATILVRLLLP